MKDTARKGENKQGKDPELPGGKQKKRQKRPVKMSDRSRRGQLVGAGSTAPGK